VDRIAREDRVGEEVRRVLKDRLGIVCEGVGPWSELPQERLHGRIEWKLDDARASFETVNEIDRLQDFAIRSEANGICD
jgi:hypothetical protein